MTSGYRESDSLIVSKKPSNKVGDNKPAAEKAERSRLAKGNSSKRNRGRTQSRITLQSELERVRQAAQRNREERFTALWHHVYEIKGLRRAYLSLKRRKAAGIDGQTWEEYGKNLDENLKGLSERLRRGAYRAKPVRRTYIPKRDGRKRPIGIPVLEDKIVQRSMVEVLNAIYEVDFMGFSYGFKKDAQQIAGDQNDPAGAHALVRSGSW